MTDGLLVARSELLEALSRLRKLPRLHPVDGLTVPANAPARQLLKLFHTTSETDLALAGLSGRIEKAVMLRNSRLSKAADLLRDYGVTTHDLAKLVEDCVSR